MPGSKSSGSAQTQVVAAGEAIGKEPELAASPSKKPRVMAVPLPSAPSIADRIGALKAQQLEVQRQRKDIQKSLRNAERRRQRLKAKARQLTDDDLVAVQMLRGNKKGYAELDAASAAAASADKDPSDKPSPSPAAAATDDGLAPDDEDAGPNEDDEDNSEEKVLESKTDGAE